MQVTTGGVARAQLLFKLSLAFGLGIIVLSIALIWFYRKMELSDLAESVQVVHSRVVESLTGEGGQRIASNDLSLAVEQTALNMEIDSLSLLRENGSVITQSISRKKTFEWQGHLPDTQTHFIHNKDSKIIYVSVFPSKILDHKLWILAETDLTQQIAYIDTRAWRIILFAFLFEGMLFAMLLWMARRGDESLMQSQKEQVSMENELFFLSHYDTVTHLPNRTLFWERLDTAIVRAQRLGKKISLIVFDLDGFKKINEEHGRSVGDKALAEMARRLQACAHSNDLISRIGPDEFALLREDLDGEDSGSQVAQALLKFEQINSMPWHSECGQIPLTVHHGIAFFPDHGMTSEEILAKAQKEIDPPFKR